MNSTHQDADWSKLLKEAKAVFKYHTKEAQKAKVVIPFLEAKVKKCSFFQSGLEVNKALDFSVSKEEVEKYLFNRHFIDVSNGRMGLFVKKVAEANKPLHYRDFVKEVNRHGDDVTNNAFYVTVNRVAEKFGLDKKGGGIFALQSNSKFQHKP